MTEPNDQMSDELKPTVGLEYHMEMIAMEQVRGDAYRVQLMEVCFEKGHLQGRVITLETQIAGLEAELKALRASSFTTAVPSADYEKLKAENERLRKAWDWQPIETAPMDGTDILCFCVEPEFEGEENPWTEFRVCFYGVLTEGESCWMSHYGYEQRPTHWMSLPNPPTTQPN